MPKRDEVVVPAKRLTTLLDKERAHDDYLTALRDMHSRRVRMARGGPGTGSEDYRRGWLDSLREHTAAIVAAMRKRGNG